MSKRQRQQPWMLLLLLLMMMLVGGSLMVLKFHLVATAHHELLATCPENPNIPPLQVLDLGDQSALSYITSHWLKERYGHLYVHAAESSRVREDMTNAEDGGLGERKMLLRTFLDGFEENRHETYPFNYVKVVDPEYSEAFANPKEINLLGEVIRSALLRELLSRGILPPAQGTTYSLWLGHKGSTTAMHVDDQSFNALLVLQGAKRVVVVEPLPTAGVGDGGDEFACAKPAGNPHACWTGIDILSQPAERQLRGARMGGGPPPLVREFILRPGQALLIPEMHWHSVENLEPTIAVGINERMRHCTGARFRRLPSLPRSTLW